MKRSFMSFRPNNHRPRRKFLFDLGVDVNQLQHEYRLGAIHEIGIGDGKRKGQLGGVGWLVTTTAGRCGGRLPETTYGVCNMTRSACQLIEKLEGDPSCTRYS